VVRERREIALMAQDMKILLQMVRWACYSRVSRRVMHDQVGWVGGMMASDPGLGAALAIQQAKALQHDLYLIFIDLATFFPSIDRGVLKAAELWHGIPDDPDNAVQCHR
jgi:hypothetical protein